MNYFEDICKLLRYYILTATTKAGSGHVTSSLSSVEIMAILFYKYYRFDLDDPKFINNDRLIFSKGHASPLFYALYTLAGKVSEEEMLSFRQFDSVLEGHPTKRFKYTEIPTGSLGQGLSVGVGMAMSAKMDKLDFLTYVLLGDGEMAEGQIWEALEFASYYKLNNLIGIIDINRLGQSGQTLLGHNIKALENRIKSFGWITYVINNGHDLQEIDKAYQFILSEIKKTDAPVMILAKTIKGKGVSFLEDKEGWHGRALSESEYDKALIEIGKIDKKISVSINKPVTDENLAAFMGESQESKAEDGLEDLNYSTGNVVSTREAYGRSLADLGDKKRDIISLDADVSNSTYSYLFRDKFPDRFLQMFIAEQNMVTVAVGLSERGKVPYVSTFSAFIERAFDQVRIACLSKNHLVICGSHAGVSIGEDGPSQMGLEDMSYFRSLPGTTVFYPSDAVSCYKLTQLSYKESGIVYIRATRPKTHVIYGGESDFKVGGSFVLRSSEEDVLTIIAAGITLHESLKAYEILAGDGIKVGVIDAYCIKPIDKKTIQKAAEETGAVVSVEDHYIVGGLGDAVLEALSEKKKVSLYKLGVTKVPRSGASEKLLEYEEICAEKIVDKVKKILS